jgi:two-component sensor histidine kinase
MGEKRDASGLPVEARLSHYSDSQAAMRAMLALDAGRMGSWRWDITNGTVTGDPFVADLLGMDVDAQPWPVDAVFASMHPDDLPKVQAEVDKALAGADLYEVEFRDRVVDPDTGEEGLRWLGARGSVTRRSADGDALEMIGVNWDATEQKTQEERLAMLAGEMDHRVKNAFAVMRALINLGQRTEGSKKDFAETLKAQVQAMADAHAISARLARETKVPTSPIPIAEVLDTALMPWVSASGGMVREDVDIVIKADDTITIQPAGLSAIAMLVYEMVTNATKHGPLGEHGGSLRIVLERIEGDKAQLRWIEHTDRGDLRDKVKQEARDGVAAGFGSMLTQHCVATLGARMKRDLTDEGLQFEITMPLEQRA